jgi:sec-independent protein translocase protein TatB
LPIALKAITTMVKKARRMAAEFQTHVDDLVKDADLHEVRDQFRQIRNLDIRGTIARAVDGDGSIRNAFKDPIREPPPVVTTPVEAYPEHSIATPPETPAPDAPAFVPPESVPKVMPAPVAPAFIPPEAAHHGAAAPHSSGV